MKTAKKSLSVLLSLLMLLSMFVGMTFTASATHYSNSEMLALEDLQPGDSIAYDTDFYYDYSLYSLVLKGGTYCTGNPGYYYVETIYPDDFTISSEMFYFESHSKKPCIYYLETSTRYYFIDANDEMSDTIYVLDADHTNHVIILGGFDPANVVSPSVIAAAKTAAKKELAAYKNADDYRDAQKTELANAITTGYTAIDTATTIAEVEAALVNAKAAIDAIKTDAELTAGESEAEIEPATDLCPICGEKHENKNIFERIIMLIHYFYYYFSRLVRAFD